MTKLDKISRLLKKEDLPTDQKEGLEQFEKDLEKALELSLETNEEQKIEEKIQQKLAEIQSDK